MIACDEKVNDKSNYILALEARASTPAQYFTNAGGTDATPSTLARFISTTSADPFCQNAARLLSWAGTRFTFHEEEVLVRRLTFDKALQKLKPPSLRQRRLHSSRHSPPSGHSEQCRMYGTLRKE